MCLPRELQICEWMSCLKTARNYISEARSSEDDINFLQGFLAIFLHESFMMTAEMIHNVTLFVGQEQNNEQRIT